MLGPLEVRVDGRPVNLGGARSRLLLCRLLVDRGHVVSDGRLRDDVWGDRETSDAVLKVAVSRLRSALGPAADALRRERQGYLLVRSDVAVDEDRFDALVAEARSSADPLAAADLYDRALRLWRGEPFADVDEGDAIRTAVERLRRQRQLVEEERAESLLTAGRHREVVAELEAACLEHPDRERLAMALARALYRSGDHVGALAALRRTERHLRTELGLTPSGPFRELEHAVLEHDLGVLGVPVAGDADDEGAALRTDIEVAGRAADAMVSVGAPDEGVRLALRAVESARRLGDSGVLVRSLARLGRLLSLAERGGEVGAVLDEAAALARRSGDHAGLAQVAIARFGLGVSVADPDALLATLAEPLAGLPIDAPETVDLLCAAVHQLAYTVNSPGADALLQRAERLADRVADARAHAVARAARAVLAPLRRATVAEQQRLAQDAVDAAEGSVDPGLRVLALHGRARALMEAGRIDDLAAMLDDFGLAARRSHYPFAWLRSHLLANAVDLARGELEGLEERIVRTLGYGMRLGVASAPETAGVQLIACMLEQERYDEVQAAVVSRPDGASPTARAVGALLAALRGDVVAAVAALDALLSDPAGHEPALPQVTYAAEAAALAGSAGHAARFAGALAASSGRFATFGHATVAVGPVDRARGLALSAAGRHDEAVAALDAAFELSQAGGARLWADRSAIDLAGVLVARGAGGDGDRARRLLDGVRPSPCLAASARLAAELTRADALVR